jgi:hypothetical protein
VPVTGVAWEKEPLLAAVRFVYKEEADSLMKGL